MTEEVKLWCDQAQSDFKDAFFLRTLFMGKRKIQKTLKVFTQRVKKDLQADKVILFGSYASGKANDYSDVDVVVLSKVFAKVPKEERLDLLYPMTKGLSPDIHPFGYTKEEFKGLNKFSTISEARQAGQVIS